MSKYTVHIAGGDFLMGSNRHYPEERPERMERVSKFDIDIYPVRNMDFAAFVLATNYRTLAERNGFSHVFQMSKGPVPLNNPDLWWKAVQGACWQNPNPGFELPASFDQHPVVHIALEDAKAYASWAGGRLPSEKEWEFAARGGLHNTQFAWGEEFAPAGQRMAQVWQGAFPWYYASGAIPSAVPVGLFPANGYGLFDMIGNTWEWTQSNFAQPGSCCSCSPQQDAQAQFTLKGGSHLCAAEYCLRYRPAARIGVAGSSTTSHIGFRCVYDL